MREAVELVARFMELAACTAPKALGQNFVVTKVISGPELGRLAEAMEAYGRQTNKKDFDRDADGVRRSDALLLIGLKGPNTLGLNCGACGHNRCEELRPREGPEYRGPVCAWRLVDFGIAVGSAAKTAGFFNVDNRVMYRAGVVARRLGLLEAELVLGIPLSATGKNIYFDRRWPPPAGV
ncbi:MAG: ferredoxin domain-containing protein [Desulfotomaculales bacterium]